MAEILDMLDDVAARTHCFAALDTVEFLRRSGRLTRFQWGLASILRIKPLLKMNNGEPEMERVRTSGKAVNRLMELISGLGPLEKLAVVHTHALSGAESLRNRAHRLFPAGADPLFAEVTPVIGAHIGPGAVGFVAVTARS
jgi:DegV family protein with EDD domain